VLGAALFHVEMGRVENVVAGRPRGQLATRGLPTLYLDQGKGQVDGRIVVPLQGNLANVGFAVPADEGKGGLGIHIHAKLIKNRKLFRKYNEN